MEGDPGLNSRITVTLHQIGSTIHDVLYDMALQDNTPGQRWFCTGQGVPYGECYETSNAAATGTTWIVGLQGDGTYYSSSLYFTLDRENEDPNPLGAYVNHEDWRATAALSPGGGLA